MENLIEIDEMLKKCGPTFTPQEQEFRSWLDRRRTVFINHQLNKLAEYPA